MANKYQEVFREIQSGLTEGAIAGPVILKSDPNVIKLMQWPFNGSIGYM